MEFAQRLAPLRSNVFADMDRAKKKAIELGQDLIDLSLGSSDLPVAPHIINRIAQSVPDPKTHGYLLFNRTKDFRVAVANWYEKKFGIAVNPETEVLPLIGSQEGTAHFPLAILNPGDIALLLDPGYPSHAGGVYLASGEIYPMPLSAENGFLPIFGDIPSSVISRSKLMVLSYPHNPTTAIAPLSFFEEAVAFCEKHNIVLVHDFPYVDLVFPPDNYDLPIQSLAPSILQADRDKKISIEFFSLSKSYNMGGFRVGYAIGNAELITALRQIKATVDFNQYYGILEGGITALTGPQDHIKTCVDIFRERRDVFLNALDKIGWEVPTPKATMYIWAKLPNYMGKDSIKFALELIEKTGVVVSPGTGFGKCGEGYVRFALVQNPDILQIAVERIAKFI